MSTYKISKDDIIKINRKLEGSLSRDGSIDFALSQLKNKRIGQYKKLAYLWRAILVDHPFSDGNKRTAVLLAIDFAIQCNKRFDDEKLAKIAVKIAKENTTNINKIERKLKNAIK